VEQILRQVGKPKVRYFCTLDARALHDKVTELAKELSGSAKRERFIEIFWRDGDLWPTFALMKGKPDTYHSLVIGTDHPDVNESYREEGFLVAIDVDRLITLAKAMSTPVRDKVSKRDTYPVKLYLSTDSMKGIRVEAPQNPDNLGVMMPMHSPRREGKRRY
jgi:hypothetical protein